ncbi:MAG: nuclear transport factor 2 family protein [Phycisphaerales bacterium]
MRSLWAEDAVVNAGGNTFVGPDDIADFFSASPNWGVAASLAPAYKTNYQVRGNMGMIQFECVIVNTGDLDPLQTPLSTIPFGGQTPDVEIVQHSTATCTAIKDRGRWVLLTFDGSAGCRTTTCM